MQIEAYCRQVRNERNLYLPSPKVRELLTEATRQLGILKRKSPPGVSPAQYELNDNSELVANFLGIELNVAADKPDEPAEANLKESQVDESGIQSENRDEPDENLELIKAFDLLSTAIDTSKQKGRSLKLSAIKKRMKQLSPDFDEKEITTNGKSFRRFSDFVRAAETAGVVNIKGKGAQAEVHPKD